MKIVAQGGDLLAALNLVEHARVRKDYGRPILTSVLLSGRTDGLWMVASDNYRISACRVALSEGDAVAAFGERDVSIRGDWIPVLKAWLGAVRKIPVLLKVTTEAVEFRVGGSFLPVQREEGIWPDVWHLIGQPDPPIAFTLNPAYLADLGKSLKSDTINVRNDGPLKPIVFARDGFREVVMPVRVATRDEVPYSVGGDPSGVPAE